MKKRDYSLDLIKGAACILMLIAHSKINPTNKLLFIMLQISGFAPILFFAVSGVTATFQVAKKKISNIIIFYILLGILGLSYNIIWKPQTNIFEKIDCNVLQIIAIGAITISLFEYYLKPQKIYYLLFTGIAFITHYLFKNILQIQDFFLNNFLFVGDAAGKTFPIFPWISIFFIGVLVYYSQNYWNIISSGLIFLIMTTIILLEPSNIILVNDKWSVSTVYFLRYSSLLCLCFYISRKYIKYLSETNLIIWLGKNSLLFLYVHFIPVKFLFPPLKIDNAYIVWLSSFLISIFIMQSVEYLNKFIADYFNEFYTWIILLNLVIFTPILFHNLVVVQYLELGAGILFASNYQVLPRLLANRNDDKAKA